MMRNHFRRGGGWSYKERGRMELERAHTHGDNTKPSLALSKSKVQERISTSLSISLSMSISSSISSSLST